MAASVGSSIPFYGQIDFDSIPRHPTGYVRIPKFLFENCNQYVVNNYSDTMLANVRVKTQDRAELRRLLAFVPADKREWKKEEWDWVYALDHVEKHELTGGLLTADGIIRLNGMISRHTNENAGQFRTRNLEWTTRDINTTENFAKQYLVKFLIESRSLDYTDVDKTDLFARISGHSDAKLPEFSVKVSKLKSTLRNIKIHPETVFNAETGQDIDVSDLDPNLVDKWAKEFPGKRKGTIDVIAWLQEKIFFFPFHKEVESRLKDRVDVISNPDMHPIEKACRIWFDVIRIHVSVAANKRTGRAVGSQIMLSHGYLPPEISGETGKRYEHLLWNIIHKEDGYIPLMHFVVEEMKKTHAKYASIPGYLEAYQAPAVVVEELAS